MAQSVSDSEFELMKIIWESGGSAFYAQIAGRLAAEGNTWNKNTIITLLSRLVEKGMLRTDKFGRRNRYTALLSQEEYQAGQTESFVEKIYEGNVQGLLATLIKRKCLRRRTTQSCRNSGTGGKMMSELWKLVLSLSLSGTLLMLLLSAGKHIWKKSFSKTWQYYIWLVVAARLLLPVTAPLNLVGGLMQPVEKLQMQAETGEKGRYGLQEADSGGVREGVFAAPGGNNIPSAEGGHPLLYEAKPGCRMAADICSRHFAQRYLAGDGGNPFCTQTVDLAAVLRQPAQ